MMRAVLLSTVILVGVLILLGLGLLLTNVVGTFRSTRVSRPGPGWGERAWNVLRRCLAKREARVHAKIPWTGYSKVDPSTGNYLIGIRKTTHGRVVIEVEMARVPAGDAAARFEWEVEAFNRAVACNVGQQP